MPLPRARPDNRNGIKTKCDYRVGISESIFRGQSDKLLHAVSRAVVGHVPNIEVALGINREAMGPIERSRDEFPLLGQRESPDLLDNPIGIEAQEIDSPLDELSHVDEAFLTSTLRDVQPIETVNGTALPQAPGPITSRLAEAFADLAKRDTDPC